MFGKRFNGWVFYRAEPSVQHCGWVGCSMSVVTHYRYAQIEDGIVTRLDVPMCYNHQREIEADTNFRFGKRSDVAYTNTTTPPSGGG